MTNNLDALRHEIDKLDSTIVELLTKRMNLVKEIASYKLSIEEIEQTKRNKDVFKKVNNTALQYGLNTAFVSEIFEKIIKQSIQEQKELLFKRKI